MQVLRDNYLGNHLEMRAAGRRISITSLPSGGSFDAILVTVEGSDGQQYFSQSFPRGTAVTVVPEITVPGLYGLKVFAGPAADGFYHSWFCGQAQFPLLFNGKTLSFRDGPFTLANARFVESIPVSRRFLSSCLLPTPEIQCDSTPIQTLAREIGKGRHFSESLLVGVNDWVAKNIAYDMDALIGERYRFDDISAEGVLEARRGVCCGYSNLTSALLRACGIPTLNIPCFSLGYGVEGWWYDRRNLDGETNHVITAAYVAGRWRMMDVTWNSDLQYSRGKFTRKSGLGASRAYCDASIPFLSLTHRLDEYDF